jgi:hypothetical protein
MIYTQQSKVSPITKTPKVKSGLPSRHFIRPWFPGSKTVLPFEKQHRSLI